MRRPRNDAEPLRHQMVWGPYIAYWQRVEQRLGPRMWRALFQLPGEVVSALLPALGIVPWEHSPEYFWHRQLVRAGKAPMVVPAKWFVLERGTDDEFDRPEMRVAADRWASEADGD